MPRPGPGATGLGGGGTSRTTKSDTKIEGSKVFVPTAVVDIGYLRNRFDTDPDAEPIRSLVIRGYIDHEGRAMAVATDARISFDPRATMMKFIAAAREGGEPADDEVVDFGEIVGYPIAITVKSNPVRDGQGFWLRLSAPTALVEGTPAPDSLMDRVLTADVVRDPFQWKTEEELARIKRKLIPATETGAGEQPERLPDNSDHAIAIPQSEITVKCWREVRPVLSRVLDNRFAGDARKMFEYFQTEMEAGDPWAIDIIGFMAERDAKVIFRFGGRTNADAQDLRAALEGYEQRGAAAAAATEPAAESAAEAEGGDIDPTDLPMGEGDA